MALLPSGRAGGGRILALFFDGSSNQFSNSITNVANIFSFLTHDNTRQLNYYQSGIGTYRASPLKVINTVANVADLAVAWSLETHVKQGYRFLMNNYQPGDKIFIFGFSRGSYTARAVCGFLDGVGLLFAGADDTLIDEAFTIYKYSQRDRGLAKGMFGSATLSQGFKNTFCREVSVEFLGCFDTVASVGAIIPRYLPFAQSPTHVKCFRHALSLDERRGRFTPYLWGGDRTETMVSSEKEKVKEVWFAGDHCDVGGGGHIYDDEITARPSQIPLVWMMREAHHAGLLYNFNSFKESALFEKHFEVGSETLHSPSSNSHSSKEVYMDSITEHEEISRVLQVVNEHWKSEEPIEFSSTSTEPKQKANDARIAVCSDALKMERGAGFFAAIKSLGMAAVWWTMEVLPTLKVIWVDETTENEKQKKTVYSFFPSLGRGRQLNSNPLFHPSVKFRTDQTNEDYEPRAKFVVGESKTSINYRD